MEGKQKMTTRQLNALKTKDKIFDAAIELFREKGFENVNITDITERCGVAVGSFYSHFKSKRELLNYTISRYDQFAAEAYALALKETTFEEQLVTFLREDYRLTVHMGRDIMRALYYTFLSDDVLYVMNPDREVHNYMADMIRLGMKQGELNPEVPVSEYVSYLVTTLIGLDLRVVTDHLETDPDTYVTNIARKWILGGLRAVGEKKTRNEEQAL